jgi:S1-C subfamily serine protease
MHMSRMFSGTTRPLRIAAFRRFILLLVSLGLVGGLCGNGWLFPAQSQAALPLFPAQSQAALPSAFLEGFSEIVEKVRPAVVNVAVTGGGGSSKPLPPGPFGGPPGGGPPGRPPGGPGMSAGSGVVIDPRGLYPYK